MQTTNNSELPNNEYILVKGDVSGIQDFIFNVRSKKAAKSIKGRSFFIKVLTEIAIRYLFDLFNVSLSQREEYRISTSGGNFFLQLPKDADVEIKIHKAQKEFSKSLRFSGLNIALNYTDYVKDEYSKCLILLNSNVRENKLRLYGDIDQSDFEIIFSTKNKGQFELIDKNEKWIDITKTINQSDFFTIKELGNFELKINSDSIELVNYTCKFNDDSTSDHFMLNNYLESLFPIEYGQILDFESLAEKGKGVRKLGILKMDVDNLGTTLEKISSVSDHKEFDSELNKFFNTRLKDIIETKTNNNLYKFQNKIYTVTAGGDDSFFVGNWRTILDLAIDIQSEFSNYSYFQKKGLTISAGYIIVDSKFPVVRFSQLADDALHKAKYKYDKGNICIFNEVISWKKLNETLLFMKKLDQGVTDKSKGLLAKSRQAAIKGIDENKISLKDNWEMSYFLRDCNNTNLVEEIRNNIKSFLIKSITSIDQKSRRSYRLILPIAARILELEKR